MSEIIFEQLSPLSKVILISVVGSLVGLLVTTVVLFFRAVGRAVLKPKKSRNPRIREVASRTSAQSEEVATVQTQRQATKSYKQLIQKSKSAKNKKQDEGQIAEHPLYIFSLKDHRDRVNGFDWAPDGSVLASACEDRRVHLFGFSKVIDKGIQTRHIQTDGGPVDVGFLGDANHLVVLCTGYMDTASLVFYVNQPSELGGTQWTCTKTIEKIFGTDRPLRVETVKNSEVGKVLVIACSTTKEAKVFDSSGLLLTSFAPNSFLNHDLAVAHNAKLASIATFTADAKVWELKFSRDGVFKSSKKVMDLRGHKSKVMTVAFSMDATRAVSVSQDGIMKIWNVDVRYDVQQDPDCLNTVQLSLKEGEFYHRMAFGPNYVLAAALKNNIHFIDISDGALIGQIDQAHDGNITALHWSSHQLNSRKGTTRVLASSANDKRVRMWVHPDDV